MFNEVMHSLDNLTSNLRLKVRVVQVSSDLKLSLRTSEMEKYVSVFLNLEPEPAPGIWEPGVLLSPFYSRTVNSIRPRI